MGEARGYAVGLLIFSLGVLQATVGLVEILSAPERMLIVALSVGKLLFGLLLLPAARDIAGLRKRGLWLAVIGFSGVVSVQLLPLLRGSSSSIAVGSILLSLSCLLYLFLHEDALGDRSERELTEETNPHDFIR